MRLADLAIAASLLAAAPAFAAPGVAAPAPDRALDGLFGRLNKAQSSDDAKPIEKEILIHFLQSGSASVDLLMSRVDALMGGNDANNAAKILAAVTQIAPNYAEGWHQRGKLEEEQGHDEAAMVSLQKAINLNPREFVALVELGDMLAEYGAKPAALASYKKALALDPHFEGLDKRVEQLSREVEGEKI
jgi:tetratricopeptide (TPR) repeat protein